jgi:hypothetical protein
MITNLSRGRPLPEGKSKTFNEHAEEMLTHFAGIDRAACDLLNLVQVEAVKQLNSHSTPVK